MRVEEELRAVSDLLGEIRAIVNPVAGESLVDATKAMADNLNQVAGQRDYRAEKLSADVSRLSKLAALRLNDLTTIREAVGGDPIYTAVECVNDYINDAEANKEWYNNLTRIWRKAARIFGLDISTATDEKVLEAMTVASNRPYHDDTPSWIYKEINERYGTGGCVGSFVHHLVRYFEANKDDDGEENIDNIVNLVQEVSNIKVGKAVEPEPKFPSWTENVFAAEFVAGGNECMCESPEFFMTKDAHWRIPGGLGNLPMTKDAPRFLCDEAYEALVQSENA